MKKKCMLQKLLPWLSLSFQSWPTYEDIYKKVIEVATFLDLPRFPAITEDCYLHPNILCMKFLMEVNLPGKGVVYMARKLCLRQLLGRIYWILSHHRVFRSTWRGPQCHEAWFQNPFLKYFGPIPVVKRTPLRNTEFYLGVRDKLKRTCLLPQ